MASICNKEMQRQSRFLFKVKFLVIYQHFCSLGRKLSLNWSETESLSVAQLHIGFALLTN